MVVSMVVRCPRLIMVVKRPRFAKPTGLLGGVRCPHLVMVVKRPRFAKS